MTTGARRAGRRSVVILGPLSPPAQGAAPAWQRDRADGPARIPAPAALSTSAHAQPDTAQPPGPVPGAHGAVQQVVPHWASIGTPLA